MTKWLAWFAPESKAVESYCRLLVADNIETAETIAIDFAQRDSCTLIGIIIAPGQYDPENKT